MGQQTSSFPHWSGLALGLTQPSVQRVPGFSSGGKAARIWCWPPVSSITKVHTGFSYYFTAPPHVQGMRHLVPGVQKSRVTELYTKAPNICGTSVWNSVYVTHLALWLSKWLLDFCKMCATLNYLTTLIGNMTSKWIGWAVEGNINFIIWGPSICLEELRKTTKASCAQFCGRDFTPSPSLPLSIRIQSRPPDAEVPSSRECDGIEVSTHFSCLVPAVESCLMVSKHARTFALSPSECHSSSSVSSQLSFVYVNSANGTLQEVMSLKVWIFFCGVNWCEYSPHLPPPSLCEMEIISLGTA